MKRFILLLTGLLLMTVNVGSVTARSPLIKGDRITPISWDTSAAGFKGEKGQTYRFRCPAEGTAQSIYGSDIYTDDSSICTAAVHAGIIDIERGGVVAIEIRPGRSIYGSTTRHGIKSNSFGQYGRSFVILSSDTSRNRPIKESGSNPAPDSDNEDSKDTTPIAWDTSAGGFTGEEGQTYKFRCPAEGTEQPIYGNDVYTDDSSICTAAVHVGLISLERGGIVTIEIRPGRSTYGSTTRHSIKSNSFGQYGRSFVVR
jgi:hypothetical protein